MRFDSARKFKIVEDSNGFLVAEGVIASAGEKLVYKDGVETISESALFQNMDEWEGLPLTLNHPKTLLTPDTAQKHQVGSVVKAWRQDNELWARFKVTAKTALDAVKSGVRGLSAGYLAQLDGQTQVGRSNNHLALCPVGRSPSSGIRADERRDSFDLNNEVNNMYTIKFPNGKEIKLDCSEAESQLLQGQIDGLSSRADEAESSLVAVNDFMCEHFDMEEKTDMAKKLDMMKDKLEQMKKDGEDTEKLQAQYDELQEKMKKSEGKMDSNELSEIFDTHEKALKLNHDIKIRKDSGEIKTSREIAIEAMPNVKMDDKCDIYVMARLDSAIENIESDNVRKQRGNSQRIDSKNTQTVQQRADSAFYNGTEE